MNNVVLTSMQLYVLLRFSFSFFFASHGVLPPTSPRRYCHQESWHLIGFEAARSLCYWTTTTQSENQSIEEWLLRKIVEVAIRPPGIIRIVLNLHNIVRFESNQNPGCDMNTHPEAVERGVHAPCTYLWQDKYLCTPSVGHMTYFIYIAELLYFLYW
jgi:hypothetical protein